MLVGDRLSKFSVVLSALRIPPVPAVAMKIINVLDNKNSATWQLEQVVGMDPVMTASILEMSNSMFFTRGIKIATVNDAIFRLGYGTVRENVIMASLFSLRLKHDEIDHRLWQHSLATAVAAIVIARLLGHGDSSDFLIPSLLHDIGKIILNRNVNETYLRAIRLMDQQKKSAVDAEAVFFDVDHTDVGAYAAAKWHLPDNIADVIAFHHRSDIREDIGTARLTAEVKERLLVNTLADFLSGRLGYGVGEASEDRAIESLALLGISDPLWFDNACDEVQKIFPAYLNFLADN